MDDTYHLSRFVKAQEGVYEVVVGELRAVKKRSHWMWYIFPQISGLGTSTMAQRYAISSLQEAEAYLDHSILGLRLRECAQIVVDIENRSADEVFGHTDALKFRSCMTLFEQAAEDCGMFRCALEKFFGGRPDELTLGILRKTNYKSRRGDPRG